VHSLSASRAETSPISSQLQTQKNINLLVTTDFCVLKFSIKLWFNYNKIKQIKFKTLFIWIVIKIYTNVGWLIWLTLFVIVINNKRILLTILCCTTVWFYMVNLHHCVLGWFTWIFFFFQNTSEIFFFSKVLSNMNSQNLVNWLMFRFPTNCIEF
jgi:hypothetical protein